MPFLYGIQEMYNQSLFMVAGMRSNRSLGLVYSVCISGGNNVKLHGILVCLFTDRENLAPVLPLGILFKSMRCRYLVV